MISNFEANFEAKRYKANKAKYNYNDSYSDIEFSRGRKNYDKLINRICNLNLPSYHDFTYSKLSLTELQECLTELLIKLLGPDFREQIVELSKILKPVKSTDYFDTVIGFDNNTPKQIYVPKPIYSIEIACTANSFIRCLMTKYEEERLNGVLSNYHYRDLLNIVIEYIICFEIHKEFKKDEIIQRHDIIRTQAIQLNILEDIETKRVESILKKQNILMYNELKDYFEFEPHVAYGNVICDIYANRLLDIYRAMDEELLSLIRNIIQGNNSIDDLLKHYNISLTDQFTIQSYETKLSFLKEKYSKK